MSEVSENPYLAPQTVSTVANGPIDPRLTLVCAAALASLVCFMLFHFANPLASFDAWADALLVVTVSIAVFLGIYKWWKSDRQHIVFFGGFAVGCLSVLICTILKWIQVGEIVRSDDVFDLAIAMLICGGVAGIASWVAAILVRQLLPLRRTSSEPH